MAVLPHPPQLPGQPTDKVQHVLAFAVLTGLAVFGWPAASRWRILLALAGFGALIEFVQAIPALHRSSELLDWIADVGAVLAVLGLAALVNRLRRP